MTTELVPTLEQLTAVLTEHPELRLKTSNGYVVRPSARARTIQCCAVGLMACARDFVRVKELLAQGVQEWLGQVSLRITAHDAFSLAGYDELDLAAMERAFEGTCSCNAEDEACLTGGDAEEDALLADDVAARRQEFHDIGRALRELARGKRAS